MNTFISDSAHFSQVIERAMKAKHTLWIGTADIKDLSRFLTKSKGGLEVSSYFDTLVDELNIKPTELDLNGHWK